MYIARQRARRGRTPWRRLLFAVTLLAGIAVPVEPTTASASFGLAHPASPIPRMIVAAAKPAQTIPRLDLGPAPRRCFQLGSSDNICKPVVDGQPNPSSPYAPNNNYINSTYYGQLYLNPHVVKPGQDITGTAVTALKATIGWSAPPGPVVAGCHGQDPNCSWKAPGVTGAWVQWHISFTGFFGTGDSADYYAVDQKTAITGTFMDTDGDPIPDAAVQISGPTSGTAVTDAAGFYSAVVEAGAYTVTATATEDGAQVAGRASYCAKGTMSAQACSISVGDNDGTADFTAGQDVSGTIADQAAPQAGLTVDLSGTRDNGSSVSQKTTTDKAGKYRFTPPPGTYTVTPQVPASDQAIADGFAAQTCPGGKAQDGSCQDLPVHPDATDNVNFRFGCGVEGAQLDKVETLVDSDFGAVPYSTVQLLGKGFCPNMKVYFGNPLAESVVDTTKDPTAITKDGTVAQVVVARLATTGRVAVVSNGAKAGLDNVPIDSFRNVYGFSFPNIDGTLTEAEFEHIFPTAVVTEPYNACPPANCPGHVTELSWQALDAFSAIANDFSGGDCFGFSLGAARLAPGGNLNADIGSVQPGAKDTWDIKEDYTGNAQNPGPIVDFLNQLQLVQWSVQGIALSAQAYQQNRNASGAQIMSEITGDIGNDPASTGRYNNGAIILLDQLVLIKKPTPHTEWDGHALLAYNVENDNSGPGYGTVDVYDSNQPFDPSEDASPKLHRANANKSRVFVYANGQWSFPAEGWSGRSRTITVLSVAQLEEALDAGLTFSNPSGVNGIPDDGTVIAALTAPDGDPVDLAQGGSQGVEILPPLTGASASTALRFSGPLGTYKQTLTGKGPLSETLQAPGYQVTVEASGGTDKVTFDTATDSISVGPAATGTPSETASVTVDQDTAGGGVQSATVTGSPGAGPIALGYTAAGQATVTASAHRARDLSLAFTNYPTGAVPQSFAAPLALPAGDMAAVSSPTWASYNGAQITAAVGAAGKTPKDVALADHARAAPEPKLGHVRVSGPTLVVPVSLPALPSGSSVRILVTFLNSQKRVEHEVTSSLTKLGHASNRTLVFHVPAHLASGSTATATLVAVPGGTPELVTSSATATVPAGL